MTENGLGRCCLRISDPPMVTFLLSQAAPAGGSESNTKEFVQVVIPRFTTARISEKYTKMKKSRLTSRLTRIVGMIIG